MTSPHEPHVKSILPAYLAGELTEPEATRVREHLRACDGCERAFRELTELHRLLESDVATEPSEPVWTAVQARLHAPAPEPLRLRWILGTATAAVAGVILGLFVGSAPPQPRAETSYSLWSALGSSLSADRSLAAGFFDDSASEGETR